MVLVGALDLGIVSFVYQISPLILKWSFYHVGEKWIIWQHITNYLFPQIKA